MRNNYKLADCQACLLALFQQLSADTPPFTDWQVVAGYPAATIRDNMSSPVIYIGLPEAVGERFYQGSKSGLVCEMTIGVWSDMTCGGAEEHAIAAGMTLHILKDSRAVHSKIFTVEFGGEVFPGQTLVTQGIRIDSVTGPHQLEIPAEDELHSKIRIRLCI
ncbi:MAG TPA: hypothetical protein PLP19_22140 [bacterium]|nr:hypothetical protein [bacterium]HPN46201.1 hypothetical protein [bacterium]